MENGMYYTVCHKRQVHGPSLGSVLSISSARYFHVHFLNFTLTTLWGSHGPPPAGEEMEIQKPQAIHPERPSRARNLRFLESKCRACFMEASLLSSFQGICVDKSFQGERFPNSLLGVALVSHGATCWWAELLIPDLITLSSCTHASFLWLKWKMSFIR